MSAVLIKRRDHNYTLWRKLKEMLALIHEDCKVLPTPYQQAMKMDPFLRAKQHQRCRASIMVSLP